MMSMHRVRLICQKTHKLLALISDSGDWPEDLYLWLWCKQCRIEHAISRKDIERAREDIPVPRD